MKVLARKGTIVFMYAMYLLCIFTTIPSETKEATTESVAIADEINAERSKKSNQAKVEFKFDQTELSDIIYFLASKKQVNVIQPKEPLKQKITLLLDRKISLSEAWTLLYTLLDLAGFAMTKDDDQTYIIKKITQTLAGEPAQLFIGTDPNELPTSDERIRYIYYLSNLQIDPENPDGSEIQQLLPFLLPSRGETQYKVDGNTNSIILAGKSRDIKAAMTIIQSLDKSDFSESMQVIPLSFISATLAANIFKDILSSQQQRNRYRLDARKSSAATYFPSHLKIIADTRHNSLIVIGQKQSLERVLEFITEYLDVPLESGRSVLHVYSLQYLDANEFKETLERIVSSETTSDTGQSTGEGEETGIERYFQGVIIRSDSSNSETDEDVELGGPYEYPGSNKLVIAATNTDWLRIKALIEKLDRPQKQVIIEVLVADLTLDDLRRLGTLLRNPCDLTPSGFNVQSAQLAPAVTTSVFGGTSTTTTEDVISIASDILERSPYGSTCPASGSTDPDASLARLLTVGCPGVLTAFPGSTIMSISDHNTGRTWAITQVRKLLSNRKLISNQHFIATNNEPAELIVGESRLLPDQSSGTEGGTTQVSKKWVDANLIVNVIPRISPGGTVNLDIDIKINRFANQAVVFGTADSLNFGESGGQAENNIETRSITTTATIADEDVLALGGLNRIDQVNSVNRVPLLGRIPVLGYFLKARNDDVSKTSIVIFFYVKIVNPGTASGINKHTNEKVANAKEVLATGNIFDSLRDPITRIFFDTQPTDEPQRIIDRFLELDKLDRITESTAIRRIEREELLERRNPRVCCDPLCNNHDHEHIGIIFDPVSCDNAYGPLGIVIDPTGYSGTHRKRFCIEDEHLNPCYICDIEVGTEREEELKKLLKHSRLEPADDRSYVSIAHEDRDAPMTTSELVEASENPNIPYR